MNEQQHNKTPQPPVEPEPSTVRFNATRHGILSVSPVIPFFESEDDWIAFRDSIFDELKPRGGFQYTLVDRIASIQWRQLRVLRYEREVITAGILDVHTDLQDHYTNSGGAPLTPELIAKMERRAMFRLLPGQDHLNKIMRYSTHLHRQLLQNLNQLDALQNPRPPRPHRKDIEHTEIRRVAVRSPRLHTPAPPSLTARALPNGLW